MSFNKLTAFTQKVTDAADTIVGNAPLAKSIFDAAPEELRTYFNNLVDALKSTASGDSGAKNTGATNINGLTGSDVQSLLESLKSYSDDKFVYITEQGSNSNGNYVKYSDGSMECWFARSDPHTFYTWQMLQIGNANYYYTSFSWTFPASFKDNTPPMVFCSGDISGIGPESHTAYNASSSQCTVEHGLYGADPRGQTVGMPWNVYARGVWK